MKINAFLNWFGVDYKYKRSFKTTEQIYKDLGGKIKKEKVELRDKEGNILFSKEVDAPEEWSYTAILVASQKYLKHNEYSIFKLIDRIVDTFVEWGIKDKYFSRSKKKVGSFDMYNAFDYSFILKALMIKQYVIFNSPVFFNVGVEKDPQCSACFILDIQDSLESIGDTINKEMQIFKGGSGSGINFSNLRGKGEPLSNGGTSSGVISFLKPLDVMAGVIKSGGSVRRSAKMVILDADHPDIEEFIEMKSYEEDKVRALVREGYDGSFDGEAQNSVFFQNANNSVRVTDKFMKAVENDEDWELISRVTGNPVKTVKAKELFYKMAENAWKCGDPGIQYHDTVNEWNTVLSDGEIVASNPCLVGDTLLKNKDTLVPIKEGVGKENDPEWDWYSWKTGDKETITLTANNGYQITLTPDHRVMLEDGTFEEAQNLLGKKVKNGFKEFLVPEHKEEFLIIEKIEKSGVKEVYDFRMKEGEPYNYANGFVCHNCSEFMFLNNSACNLSSLNLVKFYDPSRASLYNFDLFTLAIEALMISMDIIVDNAYYPVKEIGENSHKYRPLGLGFANIGGLLMRMGLPYDSNDGRFIASTLTQLMTLTAYKVSSDLASKFKPFYHWEGNKKHVKEVIQKHTKEVEVYNPQEFGKYYETILTYIENAKKVLSENKYKVRNAQVTLLAPNGTTGIVMDVDSTGIEPLVALISYKQLVGGGMLTFVPEAIKVALERLLPADQVQDAIKYIEENNTIKGYPELTYYQYKIFQTALSPDNEISPMGHLKMMSAIQPYISGSSSKTINTPNSYTIEDIEEIYMEAWKMGIKAVAIYRDGSKNTAPIKTTKDDTEESETKQEVTEDSKEKIIIGQKRIMPDTRYAITHKFEIGGHKGYVTVGFFDNGDLGELFIKMSKQGSTLSGLLDAFSIAVSIGLQHGVPFEDFYRKFSFMQFEPSGITTHENIHTATSIIDYVFKWLKQDVLTSQNKKDRGSLQLGSVEYTPKDLKEPDSVEIKSEIIFQESDAPVCVECGSIMVRNGACYLCKSCGSTSGCS